MDRNFYKKFAKGFWGIGSVAYILLVGFIAVFAYMLSPDNTKNANQMHLSIHSKPPGFQVLLLKIPIQGAVNKGFTLFQGRETFYDEIPIKAYYLVDDGIEYQIYGNQGAIFEKRTLTDFPSAETSKAIASSYIEKRTFYMGTDKYGRDFLSLK